MLRKIILALALQFAALTSAWAWGGVSAGLDVGTLGPGVSASGYLNDQLNLRVGLHYLKFGYDGEESDVEYDADLELNTLMTVVDWHPFTNQFRITAGIVFNNNEVTLDGTPNQTATIGDTVYSSEQIGTLHGDATFNHLSPYLGIGYGNPVRDGASLSFMFDIGVLFQGSPDISLSADGTASGDPGFESDLQSEEDDAQDVADKFKVYPVISFGIAYYFW